MKQLLLPSLPPSLIGVNDGFEYYKLSIIIINPTKKIGNIITAVTACYMFCYSVTFLLQ